LHRSSSQNREIVTCPACSLRQFLTGDGSCRRCHQPLGVTYHEIPLPLSPLDLASDFHNHNRLGTLIRQLRHKSGRSQAWLARSTHTHRTHVSRLECGQVLPAVSTLLRIAAVLGVDRISLRIRNSPRQCPMDQCPMESRPENLP